MHKHPKLRLLLKLLQVLLFIAAWQRNLTVIETNRKLTESMRDVAAKLRVNNSIRQQTLTFLERRERDNARAEMSQHLGQGAMKQSW